MAQEKIIAEESPNPDSLRISVGKTLLEKNGWLEYTSPAESINSPLASRLLFYKFVRRVFISQEYVTVTRDPEYDWEHIIMEIREAIDRFLDSGLPASKDEPRRDFSDDAQEMEVIQILEGSIRAATDNDGGALTFVSLKDGVLTVKPRGACYDCPHILETVKKGLEPAFQKHFGFIQRVEAEMTS